MRGRDGVRRARWRNKHLIKVDFKVENIGHMYYVGSLEGYRIRSDDIGQIYDRKIFKAYSIPALIRA